MCSERKFEKKDICLFLIDYFSQNSALLQVPVRQGASIDGLGEVLFAFRAGGLGTRDEEHHA
jgi:hypothetical protein